MLSKAQTALALFIVSTLATAACATYGYLFFAYAFGVIAFVFLFTAFVLPILD